MVRKCQNCGNGHGIYIHVLSGSHNSGECSGYWLVRSYTVYYTRETLIYALCLLYEKVYGLVIQHIEHRHTVPIKEACIKTLQEKEVTEGAAHILWLFIER